jgi:hypothetical protein
MRGRMFAAVLLGRLAVSCKAAAGAVRPSVSGLWALWTSGGNR